MGNVILCTGKLATNPYTFALSDVSVYSIEEMSFYLYHHIYEIYEDFLTNDLITWVEEELGLEELGTKLRGLLENHNSLKDIVVTILCSNDYYSEKEIKELIVIMDQIIGLSAYKRLKIRGDYFLRYHMYHSAVLIYESILAQKESALFSEEEYGDILHNIAITHIHMTSYKDAALRFKEAYNLNHKEETLRQYFITLLLANDEELFGEELINYGKDEEYHNALYAWVGEKEEEAKQLKLYKEINQLKSYKEAGQVSEYYRGIHDILQAFKAQYRKEVEG